MANISNYFPHDSNARNDDRIIAVRMRLGAEGYGIYFMLLERLREANGYTCAKDYNVMAFDLRVSAEKVKAVVEDFGLFAFTEDRTRFYSGSLTKRMEVKDERAEKFKKAANARWGRYADDGMEKKEGETTHMPRTCDAHALHVQEKESKESKERRVRESEENRTREFPAPDKKGLLAKEKKEKPEEAGFCPKKNPGGHGQDTVERAFPEKRPVADLERECAAHEAWIEAVGMKNSIAGHRVLEWLRAFRLHMEASGRGEETEMEFKRYFANWTASEIRQGRAPINAPAPQTPGGKDANGKMDPTQAMQMALVRKYGKAGNGQLAIGG